MTSTAKMAPRCHLLLTALSQQSLVLLLLLLALSMATGAYVRSFCSSAGVVGCPPQSRSASASLSASTAHRSNSTAIQSFPSSPASPSRQPVTCEALPCDQRSGKGRRRKELRDPPVPRGRSRPHLTPLSVARLPSSECAAPRRRPSMATMCMPNHSGSASQDFTAWLLLNARGHVPPSSSLPATAPNRWATSCLPSMPICNPPIRMLPSTSAGPASHLDVRYPWSSLIVQYTPSANRNGQRVSSQRRNIL